MENRDNKLRVILIDPRVVLREGMHSVLEAEGDIEVVAEGTEGAQTLELLNGYPAQVVVLNAAEANGALSRLRAASPTVRVVLVGEGSEDRTSQAPGAEPWLDRDMEPEELVRAVRGAGPNSAVAGLAESKETLRSYLLSLVEAL